MTARFKEAIKTANEIEDQVRIVLNGVTEYNTDYRAILKVAIFTADHAKQMMPIHSIQWQLYETVIEVMKGRVNGQYIELTDSKVSSTTSQNETI